MKLCICNAWVWPLCVATRGRKRETPPRIACARGHMRPFECARFVARAGSNLGIVSLLVCSLFCERRTLCKVELTNEWINPFEGNETIRLLLLL